jgi:hypothetical protein
MAGEGPVEKMALIKRAIENRICPTGRHYEFRVRFAPHAVGRDQNHRYVVIAFEYGGLTLGKPKWVTLVPSRLRELRANGDPWRTGPLASRPSFRIFRVEVAVDASWSGPANDSTWPATRREGD